MIAQTLADVHKERGMRIEHAAVDVFVIYNLKTLDETLRDAIGGLSAKLLPGGCLSQILERCDPVAVERADPWRNFRRNANC